MCENKIGCGCGCSSSPAPVYIPAALSTPTIAIGEPYPRLDGPIDKPCLPRTYPTFQAQPCWYEVNAIPPLLNGIGDDSSSGGLFTPAPNPNPVPPGTGGPSSTPSDKKWWQSTDGINALAQILGITAAAAAALLGINQPQQPTPTPTKQALPWYVWGLIGVVVVAIIVYLSTKKR